MIDGLKVLWLALRHLNHRGYLYVWGNALWLLCSLPLVTLPAAWGGLVRLSRAMYHTPGATLDEYWEGFRENLRRGLVLSVVNVLVIGVNLSNLISYQSMDDPLLVPARIVWIGVLLLWIAVQFYAFPLLYEMQQPTLWGALRNALIMVLLNPLFTLTILLVVGLLALLSSVFFVSWMLLTAGAFAAIANAAVINRLQAAGHKTLPETAPTDET